MESIYWAKPVSNNSNQPTLHGKIVRAWNVWLGQEEYDTTVRGGQDISHQRLLSGQTRLIVVSFNQFLGFLITQMSSDRRVMMKSHDLHAFLI